VNSCLGSQIECLTGGLAGRCFSGLAENGNEGWHECNSLMELMLCDATRSGDEERDREW